MTYFFISSTVLKNHEKTLCYMNFTLLTSYRNEYEMFGSVSFLGDFFFEIVQLLHLVKTSLSIFHPMLFMCGLCICLCLLKFMSSMLDDSDKCATIFGLLFRFVAQYDESCK